MAPTPYQREGILVSIVWINRAFDLFSTNPEDKWDGYETTDDTLGNPWYICTVAVPHVSAGCFLIQQ